MGQAEPGCRLPHPIDAEYGGRLTVRYTAGCMHRTGARNAGGSGQG
jgi:hypothetical protein